MSSNEQDDLNAASHGPAVDYSQFTPQLKSKKKWPRIVGWTLVAIVALGGAGADAWLLAQHKSPAKANQAHGTTKSVTAGTAPYDSSNFNLNFSYPKNWVVADAGNGKLTVTSTAMQLTDTGGQAQTGKIIMTIQNENSADFSAFKTGNAVAVLDSQKLTYTKPSSTQRANTYISFLQYNTTTIRGALDAVYVTGDAGYQKDQAIPEADITKIDPVVAVTFAKCGDSKCTGVTTPISIASTMWANTAFSAPIETMLESLQFN
jgi:hypothetical protein